MNNQRLRIFACTTLAFSLAACGATVKVDGQGAAETSDAGEGGLDAPGAAETALADSAKPAADAALVADGAVAADSLADNADAQSKCPGAPGCSCKENGDCDNAQCIEIGAVASGTGKVCATPCVDKCQDGYKCTLINSGSGDSVTICVPKYIHLCDPCVKSKDCQSLGVGDAACVNLASQGNFCGTACSADGDCAAGFGCQSVSSVEGTPVKQCVKTSTAPELKYGECTCSELAVAQKAQTSCYVEHKNDKGELLGKCAGVRACGASGLTTCAAPALDVEVCDGKDNDCDGLTDEGTCDAGGACNVGSCDPQTGCQYNKLNNVPCDADKNACTDNDQCKQGVCVPGPGKICDDGNPCTSDSCDPASGCTKTVDDGKLCDADGDACTAGDHCEGAKCTSGKTTVCDNTNPCSKYTCDSGTGKCVGKAAQDGGPCDDGTVCTQTDHCQSGECSGKIVNCDDNNPCTSNSCDKVTGCAATNLDGAGCDDDNPCTLSDVCKGGDCVKGAAKICDSGATCIVGACNLASGKCDYKNKVGGAPCNDGDACSEADGCADGICQGKSLNCDDANPCTIDSCDGVAGCLHKNNTVPCSDGDACTQGDNCATGACVPGPVKVCEDNVLCTANGCNKTSGNCVFDAAAMNGTPCDDSNVCTLGDNCKNGVCAVGIAKDCNDNNICTDDLCDKTKGCSPSFNSKACDDGNFCTKDDICKFGDCEGAALGCSDGNPCTDDACDPKKGCIYSNNTGICSDGNACTSGDACKNSICGGAPVNCDDGNVCSDDSCDKVNGCVNAPNAALCLDADACTTGEKCANLNCVKKAVVCDDNNECTIDTCDAAKGCQVANVVDKTLCSGGTQWCVAGKCQAKAICGDGIVNQLNEQCDDGNNVSNDGCSATCQLETVSSCAVVKAGNNAALNGTYSLDPDGPGGNAAFNAFCEMNQDGGGWTLVMNNNTADGTISTLNTVLWTSLAEVGNFAQRWTNDYKSPAAMSVGGTQLLVIVRSAGVAEGGAIVGWRSWNLTANKKFQDFFTVPMGLDTANATGGCNGGASGDGHIQTTGIKSVGVAAPYDTFTGFAAQIYSNSYYGSCGAAQDGFRLSSFYRWANNSNVGLGLQMDNDSKGAYSLEAGSHMKIDTYTNPQRYCTAGCGQCTAYLDGSEAGGTTKVPIGTDHYANHCTTGVSYRYEWYVK